MNMPEDRPYDLEAATAAVGAGIAALVNPIAGLLAAGAIAYANNRQIRQWVSIADARLAHAERPFDADDPELMATFNRLTIGAMQTSRTDKMEMLADALANTRSSPGNPDLLQEVLASLVVSYSPEHIKMLRLVAEPGPTLRAYQIGADGYDRPLGELLPETILKGHDDPHLVAEQIWDDLARDGLLLHRYGPAMTPSGVGPADLTERGRRLLCYLRPAG